ncbi:hypothetical protein D9M68_896220 [compost metagenome]
MKPSTRQAAEASNCQVGTPNGMRAIITIGEVSGKILPNTAIPLLGSLITAVIRIKLKMIGKVMMVVNCCASC